MIRKFKSGYQDFGFGNSYVSGFTLNIYGQIVPFLLYTMKPLSDRNGVKIRFNYEN